MSKGTAIKTAVVGVALVAGAIVGASGVFASGPSDQWGCDSQHIGRTMFSFGDGGASLSQLDAAVALLDLLATDGDRTLSDYKDAFAGVGTSSYDPSTGTLYIDDKIEAQFVVTKLGDGTWTVSTLTMCMHPAEDTSPYPTPSGTPAVTGATG